MGQRLARLYITDIPKTEEAITNIVNMLNDDCFSKGISEVWLKSPKNYVIDDGVSYYAWSDIEAYEENCIKLTYKYFMERYGET